MKWFLSITYEGFNDSCNPRFIGRMKFYYLEGGGGGDIQSIAHTRCDVKDVVKWSTVTIDQIH